MFSCSWYVERQEATTFTLRKPDLPTSNFDVTQPREMLSSPSATFKTRSKVVGIIPTLHEIQAIMLTISEKQHTSKNTSVFFDKRASKYMVNSMSIARLEKWRTLVTPNDHDRSVNVPPYARSA